MAPNRRETILQATLDVVAEHGLTHATISQIAKGAQASPGIIYHYFETKDEIIHTLYQTISHSYMEALMVGEILRLTTRQWVKQFWLNSYRYFITHPKETIFLEQYKNSAYHNHQIDIESNETLAHIWQVIQADVAAGKLHDLPFEAMFAMTAGVATQMAKYQIAGTLKLDAATLDALAEASYRALVPPTDEQ